ncbi:MAG TPA: hypothetical protein VF139_03285 [Candidatus Polarisedimenticolaceae bacterium]
MQEVTQLETLLLEAAHRLEANGRRIAASGLREAVRAATSAPTAASRRRRLDAARRVAELSVTGRFAAAASS